MAALTRRRFLAGSAALGALGLGGYSTAYEAGTRLDLTSYSVTPPDWRADLKLKIAVISDIHACEPWMPVERIATIVDLANAQQPDLTVLLGDFAGAQHFVSRYIPPDAWGEQLARLQARHGVYAVLGNHDWWSAALPSDPPDNSLSVRRVLARARIPVLENQSLRLSHNGRPFWLIGLGDQLAYKLGGRRARGNDDLAAAVRPIDDLAPAILIAHEPFVFQRAPDRIGLTLCGHTHGGQVNLPLLGAPLAPTMRGVKRYVYGLYAEGRCRMIVSGGLGTSHLPVRFMRPPEVVMVTVGGEVEA